MSFKIDALLEGSFLTTYRVSSLDIDLKEIFSSPKCYFINLQLSSFVCLSKFQTLCDTCKIFIKNLATFFYLPLLFGYFQLR